MSDPPLNLAGVQHVDDSLIDPALAADAFFSATAGQEHKFDPDLAAAAVAAAAEQQAQAYAAAAGVQPPSSHVPGGDGGHGSFSHGLSGVGVDVGAGLGVDLSQGLPPPPPATGGQVGANDAVNENVSVGNVNVGPVAQNMDPMDSMDGMDGMAGMGMPSDSDSSPGMHVHMPMSSSHMAPFSRPTRDDNTPHPELLAFSNRAEFDVWFEGESSWCHFVQRRTTTPEKRAEERLRARIKAHERLLATMTPEEAASAPPLKRRRRNRTSNIKEKVTYTCHHAGRYEAKHSTTLPREKLRLNTKKSVKCDCPARIVLTEMEEGECKVSYFWRHEGHDAYAEDELESGRLPKVIDEWLVSQIQQGKDTDQIRRALMMPEEEKQAYLRQIAEDPTSVDPEKPPPLALTLRIKYPDIYNRYRKLKGPIKDFKPPKHPRARKRTADDIKPLEGMPVNVDLGVSNVVPNVADVEGDPGAQYQLQQSDVVDGFAALREAIDGNMGGDPFSSHEGLERALLALPRGGEPGDDTDLSEAVLRMASEAHAHAEENKHREAWAGVPLE